ncbi:hypothetical protein CDL12_24034 [Handroanthus impetiginosus]|uniref:Uncharacterized protein n=1 Tax=Handroanthus impetiginosus TaxID=429701 RepID=A0A2G9GDR5_9LAMI|nr:hypothetical protein CDL12_24034 [Handroanthus impetiginosus]
MASTSKLYYQRLQQEIWFDEADEYDIRQKVIGRPRSSRFRKFHIKRKLKVRIPNLKRFLRRKARVVKVAWSKIYKRLKESQSHFGDLFAGNYLFLQVTPTPLKYTDSYGVKSLVKGHGHDCHGLSSGYSVARIV